MKAMKTSSDKKNAPEHRVSQAIAKLKVLEGLHREEAEATDQSK